MSDMGLLGIELDVQRSARIGFDEAVFSEGKSAAQLDALVAEAIGTATRRLFTRLPVALFDALAGTSRAALDYDPVSRTAIVGDLVPQRDSTPVVAVITAGSSDVPVASEAVRTLAYYGVPVAYVPDIGVAGLWRLLARVDELRRMAVVITVAGMEGALPSVVGGLVPGLVIAVPTSVGYGVSSGGKVALATALSSCAPGLLTVNIDNGYGAACAALRFLNCALAMAAGNEIPARAAP